MGGGGCSGWGCVGCVEYIPDLVEDEDLALAQQAAREAEQLALAEGQVFADCRCRTTVNDACIRVKQTCNPARQCSPVPSKLTGSDRLVQAFLLLLKVLFQLHALKDGPELVVRGVPERIEVGAHRARQ